jgi:UPF0716 protein FxsA|tara:strand:- start:428 stop:847 length:420 start_codon:yes stop_codon:yes gene_type:complete
MKYFLSLFLLLPIVEIYFFVQIGSEIGVGSTILFTLLTAFLGLATIKYLGVSSFTQARQSVSNANNPGIEVLSNLALFVSGVFLLVPGFFTDFLGILLLIQPLRVIIIKFFIKKAFSNLQKTTQNSAKNKDYIDIDPDN